MNNTNNYTARMAYDNARTVLYDAWIEQFVATFGQIQGPVKCKEWVEGRKLSQGEIRLEVELNTTNNRFTFGVTPNQTNSTGVTFNTERRLKLQDSLIASEYGIYVGQPTSRTDTAYRLCTYGDTTQFAAADAAALDTQFFMNGFFQVKVSGDVVIPYRGLFNHLYIPQTQATAAPGPGSPKTQIRGAEDGQITQEANLYIIGSKDYVPEIELPVALTSAAAFLRCVLIYRGILAQNSTVIN